MTDDPYEVLGVPPDATYAEIRGAYRRLAVAHHPDHDADPESSDRMARINRAWHDLENPTRRTAHDDDVVDHGAPAPTPMSSAEPAIAVRTTRHLQSLLVASIIGLALLMSLFIIIAMAQSGAR